MYIITNWSNITKVIHRFSTETTWVPEQGYMFFSSLKFTTVSFFQILIVFGECEEKVKSNVKVALICIFYKNNLSIVLLLTYDYKVLFINIKKKRKKQ